MNEKLSRPPIRIANFAHISGRPFSLLRGVEFAAYEENLILENARKIAEREVDLALIPAIDFATQGTYDGLDFGLGCDKKSDRLILYAHGDLARLDTVYLFENSGSSALLLRLLLHEKWHVTPRLVRSEREIEPHELSEREGVLILHEDAVKWDEIKYPVAEDLVRVWHEWTGLPFVFLVWASRHGVLTLDQHRRINEVLHVCHIVRAEAISKISKQYDLPFEHLRDYVPDTCIRYHLDEEMIEGLDYFYHLCGEKKLLPPSRYKSATFKPFSVGRSSELEDRPYDELLEGVLEGRRLSVRDAQRLAQDAPIADLAMASEVVRKKLFSELSVTFAYSIGASKLLDLDALDEVMAEAVDGGLYQVSIEDDKQVIGPLGEYERGLCHLKSRYEMRIEGFDIPFAFKLADHEKVSIFDILGGLITAGLDEVSSEGGELLVDRVMQRRGAHAFSSREWSRLMQWAHRCGAASSALIAVNDRETWDERLIHLSKLRALQDLSGGMKSFGIVTRSRPHAVNLELLLRTSMLTRLFLDNFATFRLIDPKHDELLGVSPLLCGVNEVRILMRPGKQEEVRETVEMLRSLAERGITFHSRAFPERVASELH